LKNPDDIKYCFYCGAIAPPKGCGDHAPIPKRHGGTEMIPACQSCHSMKDRMRLMDWSSEWFAIVYNDIQNNVSRETKIFLMKTIDIVQDALEKQNAKND
jgi:hypothetical protein